MQAGNRRSAHHTSGKHIAVPVYITYIPADPELFSTLKALKFKFKVYICMHMMNVGPKKNCRYRIEKLLLKIKAVAYSAFHLQDLLRVNRLRRAHEGIQLKPAELIKVFHAIAEFEHCKLLVFGLGNDSPFWREANSQGRTVFLEDYKPWYDKITGMYPDLEAYAVSYPGNITRWKELLDQPEQLAMDLPAEVSGHSWDVILVDGPRGHKYSEEIPGPVLFQ